MLADDAGEPRETLGAMRRYLGAMIGNLFIGSAVRGREPIARPTRRAWMVVSVPWFGIRWCLRALAWVLRLVITWLVRVLRMVFGFFGKLFAVAAFARRLDHAEDATACSTATIRNCWIGRCRAARPCCSPRSACSRPRPSSCRRLGTELIPQLSQGEFTVKMRLPAGSPLETTDRQVQSINKAARNLPNLDSAYAVAGTGNRLDANPVDSGENTGNLDVRLQARRSTRTARKPRWRTCANASPAFPARSTNSRGPRCSRSQRPSR